MHFKQFYHQAAIEDQTTADAYGTLRDFGEQWGYSIPKENKFAALVKEAPMRTLVPSRMKKEKFKINNASAPFSIIGKGLEKRSIIADLKLAGKRESRKWSAWESILYHAEKLKNDDSPAIIFVKQTDGVLTLLDGDHRLVAAYLLDWPFKAIFLDEEKLKK